MVSDECMYRGKSANLMSHVCIYCSMHFGVKWYFENVLLKIKAIKFCLIVMWKIMLPLLCRKGFFFLRGEGGSVFFSHSFEKQLG